MRVIDSNGIVSKYKSNLKQTITDVMNIASQGGLTMEIANKLAAANTRILGEVTDLEKSGQVYNVSSDSSNSSNSGETSYDFNTNEVSVKMGTSASSSVIGHELKHAYQFEQGKVSWSRNGTSTLYDIGDETEGYNRQRQLELGIGQFDPKSSYPVWTDSAVINAGKTIIPAAYQNLNPTSMDLSSKEGKSLRKATIQAGKNGTPVQEVYIGWEKDYQKGINQR